MTDTAPETPFGGCLWPLDIECAGGDEWLALTDAQRDRAHALATATLARLTGGRVGTCPITVRPCKPSSAWAYGLPMYGEGRPFNPAITESGAWVNVGCCALTTCGCTLTHAIALPRPVISVVEVKVDGVVVPPGNYMIASGNRLVWIGEEPSPFRTTQNLALPDSEPDTYSVTYRNTYPVDSVASCAVSILASEYAKAARGAKNCRLPNNVVAVNRQGVSMELVAGSFPNGQTGIREVDAFIMLWNPQGLTSGARVWSP